MQVGHIPDAQVDVREMLRRAIYERAVLLGNGVTFDFRDLLTQARYARAAGQLMWPLIKPFNPEVLVGPGYGAAPLLYAIAMAALEDGVDLSILMVRGERKDHNRKRWVEGAPCADGARAVMIDDFLGRGSAVPLVEEALAADNLSPNICALAVLFDQWRPLGSRQLSVGKFPVVSAFKRHDIGLTRDCYDAKPPLMQGASPAFIGMLAWWRFDLNGYFKHPVKCAPVIADNAVFVGDDQSRVWRFDARTGEAVWRYDSLAKPYKAIVQQLQHVDSSLVFGCYDGTITRLNANDGSIIWRWRIGSHVHATPVVDLPNQRLYINAEQDNFGDEAFGYLHCLDWQTGRILWSHTHASWPPATAAYSAKHGVVISTCNDRSVICVDADSGTLRWQARSRGLVRGKPGLTDDCVLIATEAGFLQSFDIETGELLRSRRHGKGLQHQFLHVSDSVAYVLDDTSHLVAFNVDDLSIRWMSKFRSPGVWTPLQFDKHLVVLSREGQLAVLDPQREIKLWEGNVGGEFRQPPALGYVDGTPMLVAASHHSGLKAFKVDPFYSEQRQ